MSAAGAAHPSSRPRGLVIDKGPARRFLDRAVRWLLGSRLHGLIGFDRFAMLLTYTGRKTGKRRTTPLGYLEDGDRYVVVGAMGGAPTDPAWVHDLRADPRVRVRIGPREGAMRAEISAGEERERVWGRIERLAGAASRGCKRRPDASSRSSCRAPRRTGRRNRGGAHFLQKGGRGHGRPRPPGRDSGSTSRVTV